MIKVSAEKPFVPFGTKLNNKIAKQIINKNVNKK